MEVRIPLYSPIAGRMAMRTSHTAPLQAVRLMTAQF